MTGVLNMRTKEDPRAEGIRQIKEIGESLILNAESIVGTEKYLCNICIRAEIDPGTIPKIDISRTFFPEGCLEKNNKPE